MLHSLQFIFWDLLLLRFCFIIFKLQLSDLFKDMLEEKVCIPTKNKEKMKSQEFILIKNKKQKKNQELILIKKIKNRKSPVTGFFYAQKLFAALWTTVFCTCFRCGFWRTFIFWTTVFCGTIFWTWSWVFSFLWTSHKCLLFCFIILVWASFDKICINKQKTRIKFN